MVVQHNLPAMNAHRQLGVNNSSTSTNLEKLSSGFRINRAGDDAAGLAISEKMRGQIRGLDMATTNAENGVSLIQTAEGGLNETHAILQRMRELSVQSANGTYADEVDRENINKEVQALKSEIDRISSSTAYNGINLLDGSLGNQTIKQLDFVAGKNGNPQVADVLTSLGFGSSANLVIKDQSLHGQDAKLVISGGGITVATLQIGDQTYHLNKAGDTFYSIAADGTTAAVAEISDFDLKNVEMSGVITVKAAIADGNDYQNAINDLATGGKNLISTEKSQLIFQIGANGGLDQRVGLHVDNMSTGHLGDRVATTSTYLNGTRVKDVDVSTRENANESINILEKAINQVSGTRADLGALQNRLEHTVNNLGVTVENLQAAESSIRDVDMAKEMMQFTKNNILVQASQSMLAQANQLPQGVLQLLQ